MFIMSRRDGALSESHHNLSCFQLTTSLQVCDEMTCGSALMPRSMICMRIAGLALGRLCASCFRNYGEKERQEPSMVAVGLQACNEPVRRGAIDLFCTDTYTPSQY
jgi:hypothetical protein